MSECIDMLEGEHDFSSFTTPGLSDGDNIRHVLKSSLSKAQSGYNLENVYCFKIEAKGFLKYMIRYLMGTIFKVGSGEISTKDFKDLLTKKSNPTCKKKADPCGLTLVSINYFD